MILLEIVSCIWKFIISDSIICGIIANLIFLFLTMTFIERRKEKKALNVLKNELTSIFNEYNALYYFLIKYFRVTEDSVFSYDSKIQHCKHIMSYYYFTIPHQFYSDVSNVKGLVKQIKSYNCFVFLSEDIQFIISYIDKEILSLFNFACTVLDGKANARGGVYESICALKEHILLIEKSAKKNKIVLNDNNYYDLSDEELKTHRQIYYNFKSNKSVVIDTKCIIMKGKYMVYNNHCIFE